MSQRLVTGLVLVAALLLTTDRVRAERGILLEPSDLSSAARQQLTARIARARAAEPASFGRLAELRERLPELDARKRGPLVPVGLLLKRQGPSALWPLLEQLAVRGHGQGTLSESAWQAWRLGCIEALGMLRDPRAAAVLRALVLRPGLDAQLTRAAAAAYGKLGTDDAAQTLIALSRRPGPQQAPLLAGLGHCRRQVVAEHLGRQLRAHPEPGQAARLARALGDVGSAWAWQTPIVAQSGEQEATRWLAAQALVHAYLGYEGAARRMVTKAILVVDHPRTVELIAAARRSAGASDRPALDALARRVQRSPLRR